MLQRGDTSAFFELWSTCIEEPRAPPSARLVRGKVVVVSRPPPWVQPVQQGEEVDERGRGALPLHGHALLAMRAAHVVIHLATRTKPLQYQPWCAELSASWARLRGKAAQVQGDDPLNEVVPGITPWSTVVVTCRLAISKWRLVSDSAYKAHQSQKRSSLKRDISKSPHLKRAFSLLSDRSSRKLSFVLTPDGLTANPVLIDKEMTRAWTEVYNGNIEHPWPHAWEFMERHEHTTFASAPFSVPEITGAM
eukprot:3516039-Alexandrium_andersonii.AAC.1